MSVIFSRGRGVEVATVPAREARGGDLTAFYPPPNAANRHLDGNWSFPFGVMVPAIAQAVRLTSGTIASFLLRTYKGSAEYRQPVLDSWQARLFQDPYGGGIGAFQFWEDVVTSLELYPGAFILKRRAGARVVSLEVIDPGYISLRKNSDGTVRVFGWVNSQEVDLTREVIHIRSWSPIPAATEGVGTTNLHSTSISGAIDYEDYRGRYFKNDATPGLILKHPGMLTKEQRTDLLRAWVQRHAGADKRGLPGILWGGMDIVQGSTASMRDAQGAELANAINLTVAQMFNIQPIELMHASVPGTGGTSSTPEDTARKFMTLTLDPRLTRIESAFKADRDLFPNPEALYPGFDRSRYLRGDTATMAAKLHALVQVGAMTPNEARAELGLPPHPDGDILQITPVGGSPNPGAPTPATPAEGPTPPAA